MSGDPEQEYFVDGMVEDIITGLSRIKWLFVIARNSSFIYKGKAVDVRQVGRELGVRYVLEGGVRKAGQSRLRITAQLIEAETGAHLWAERCYDGSAGRCLRVAGRDHGVRWSASSNRACERPRSSAPSESGLEILMSRISSCALCPMPHAAMPEEAAEGVASARQGALILETDYAGATRSLRLVPSRRFSCAAVSATRIVTRPFSHARAAIANGRDDATALALGAFVISMVEHDRVAALQAFDRALTISPSSSFTLFFGASPRLGRARRSAPSYWAERGARPPLRPAGAPRSRRTAIGQFKDRWL